MASALRVLFEGTGHRVSTAATAREAIDVSTRDTPDVMLLDVTLPDGDGLAVMHELRRRDRLPRVTAALTGHDDRGIIEECLASGCREVLLKPVGIRELVAKVREWTGQSEPLA